MIYLQSYLSPLGELCLAGEGDSLVGLWFLGAKGYQRGLQGERIDASLPVLQATAFCLDAYFAHKPLPPLPKLAPKGTAFQLMVWQELLKIPYGQTVSYGELTKRLQKPPMAARALGQAAGLNPISILIPCHRVLGKDGSLTGYAGGLERKRCLLQWEQEEASYVGAF